MKKGLFVVGCASTVAATLVVSNQAAGPQAPSSNSNGAASSVSTQRAVLDRYCMFFPSQSNTTVT